MNIRNKIKLVLRNPKWIIMKLASKNILKMDDRKYLELQYKLIMDRKLNLDNPKTFNEKIQWLKLYDRKIEYSNMVDKYEAKNYVANILGEEYIIPTIGIYDRFDEIDFNKLPNQFVIKCTHDSGSALICKDKSKFDIINAKKWIEKKLKRNFYMPGREYVYKNIKPRIIIEKLMIDSNSKDLKDYKFMCFNGEVKCSFVTSNRNLEGGRRVDFFDLDWNKMPFMRGYPNSNIEIPKPKNYQKMIELSEKLSQNIPFLRVDWYEINGKIYFGELTFYPSSGHSAFAPEKYDYILGDMLKLPNEKSV